LGNQTDYFRRLSVHQEVDKDYYQSAKKQILKLFPPGSLKMVNVRRECYH
jgi:hypothetical protein